MICVTAEIVSRCINSLSCKCVLIWPRAFFHLSNMLGRLPSGEVPSLYFGRANNASICLDTIWQEAPHPTTSLSPKGWSYRYVYLSMGRVSPRYGGLRHGGADSYSLTYSTCARTAMARMRAHACKPHTLQ